MRLGLLALLSALTATACVPFARTAPEPLVLPDSVVAMKREMAAAAFTRLQRALESRDSIALAQVLHAEVFLITPSNDTLYGATAWRFLNVLAIDSARTVHLGRGKFEPCLDGDVYQYNGDFRPRGVGVAIQVTGRFGILWATDERPVVARRIVLSHRRSSLRTRLTCRPEFHVASAQNRLTFSFGPSLALVTPSTGDIARSMRSNGLTFAPYSGMEGPAAAVFPLTHARRVGVVAGVRFRDQRIFSRELQLQLALPERVRGFDASTNRYVEARNWETGMSLLFQYQRRPFRLGVGPAGRLTRWNVHQEERTLDSLVVITMTPIGPARSIKTFWNKAPGSPESTAQSWESVAGVVAEVARLIPITRRRSGELQLRAGFFRRSKSPGTPGFPASTVTNRFVTVAAMFGTGWR